jgi:hypothetical protein
MGLHLRGKGLPGIASRRAPHVIGRDPNQSVGRICALPTVRCVYFEIPLDCGRRVALLP